MQSTVFGRCLLNLLVITVKNFDGLAVTIVKDPVSMKLAVYKRPLGLDSTTLVEILPFALFEPMFISSC